MYLSGIDSEVLYINFSIKLHIGKYVDKGHYVCDLIYYTTDTWWVCDDDTITQYPGYVTRPRRGSLGESFVLVDWRVMVFW